MNFIHGEGKGLEVDCGKCGAVLAFSSNDLDLLEVGDVVACEACGFELAVRAAAAGLTLEPLGTVFQCPHCAASLTAGADLLALLEERSEGLEGASVNCPQCARGFEVQFEGV